MAPDVASDRDSRSSPIPPEKRQTTTTEDDPVAGRNRMKVTESDNIWRGVRAAIVYVSSWESESLIYGSEVSIQFPVNFEESRR